jgi:hypothetical protein
MSAFRLGACAFLERRQAAAEAGSAGRKPTPARGAHE